MRKLRQRQFLSPFTTIIGVLVIAACETRAASAKAAPPAWLQPCAELSGRAQCGDLTVAENPDRPEGAEIALSVIRLPAIAGSPESDPLFVLAGGPGEAASDMVEPLLPLFRRVNRSRDLVFVDQRGTGDSAPLECQFETALTELGSTFDLGRQTSLLRDCLENLDRELAHYTTPYAADDLEQVREALGYGRINLWGGSYGSRLGLVYLRRHGDRVRSAVLDGLAPPSMGLPHGAARDANRALAALLDHCRESDRCRERFDGLAGATRELIAELERQPRQLSLEHPLTQETLDLNLDGRTLAGLVRLALYQRDLSPVVPLAIDAAVAGDFRPMSYLLSLTERATEHLSLGLHQTVLCAEDMRTPEPAAQTTADEPILPLDFVEPLAAVCEFWPRGELPVDYFEPVHSERPVLLISGRLDPVTPPRHGETAAQALANSQHLVVPGGHHINSHTGCLPRLVDGFLDQPQNAVDAGCLENIRPLAPFVSPAGPALTEAAADD